ncbi:hypothetical protein D3C87_1579100 [compost metagenome]
MVAGDVEHGVAGDVAAQSAGPVRKRTFTVHIDRHGGCARKREQRGQKPALGLLHLRFQLQDVFIRQKRDVCIDRSVRRALPVGGER